MAERNGFTFYIIEARPKGYPEGTVRYYMSGKGYKWRNSPHEGTPYTQKTWAEKRVQQEKKNCYWIKLLTYNSTLEKEEEK